MPTTDLRHRHDTVTETTRKNVSKTFGTAFKGLAPILMAAFLAAFSSCSNPSVQALQLKKYPLDSMEGVITRSGVEFDQAVSSDGKGSLKITAQGPAVVRLFEVSDLDMEDARLIYQAKVRTENVDGQVYLEMWCHFPGKGDFFSRGLQSVMTGTSGWTTQETPFFLQKGERPDIVKLNLVINGKGTAWIDDIRLIKGPLK